MYNRIAKPVMLICGLLTVAAPDVFAKNKVAAEFIVDSQFSFPVKDSICSDVRVKVQAPKALYASKPLNEAELQRLLKDYDPERSPVKLYGYYTLKFSGAVAKTQQIRVPYYTFQGGPASYTLDSVISTGDTVTLRFGIPASQGIATSFY